MEIIGQEENERRKNFVGDMETFILRIFFVLLIEKLKVIYNSHFIHFVV